MKKDYILKQKNNIKFWLTLLFGFTAFLYAGSLSGEFIWDDRTYFLDNDLLTKVKPYDIKSIFFDYLNYWGTKYPAVDFFFVLEYNLFGKNPLGYRIVSLFLYFTISILLYFALSKFYADFSHSNHKSTDKVKKNEISALMIVSLFMLHPIHVETAAYISAQGDLLYAFFSLLAVISFYSIYKEKSYTKYKDIIIAILFYYASFLSKATAITNIIFIPIFLFLFLRKKKESFVKEALFWVLINIPVFIWIIYKIKISSTYGNIGPLKISYFDSLLRGVRIFGFDSLLLLKPNPLNFGYPFQEKFSFDLFFITGFLVTISSAFFLMFKPRTLLSFAFLIYIIYLSPYLQIIMETQNALIYDRYLFIPALGFCILVERAISFLIAKHEDRRALVLSFFASYLLFLSLITYFYIPKFKSDKASLGHAYETFPGWKRAAFDYVYCLIEINELEKAKNLTETETTFNTPPWVRDYFRGWRLIKEKKTDEAIIHLSKASFIGNRMGYYPFADVRLAEAYILRKENSKAEFYLKNVVNYKYKNPLEYYFAKKMLEEIKK
ncbi:MAG: hypothetical protein OEZ13_12745 [Spirochaetia bacterium]|nr:hypothetical protein [Spirochaetia bacterium]